MAPIEPRPRIPVFEREVIDADAKRRHGDYDKVSTTIHQSVSWGGVSVESRYSVASELDVMLDMVAALSTTQLAAVRRIWCDSKLSNSFAVELAQWDADVAAEIAQVCDDIASQQFEYAVISVHEGGMFDGGRRIDRE